MADASSNFSKTNSQDSNLNSNVTNLKAAQISKEKNNFVIPKQLEKIVESAREILSRKEYGKALSYLAYTVHRAPSLSNSVHDDFLFALKNWSSILAEHGKMDDLLKCLKEACKLFPTSAEIANNVGSTLFQLNMYDDAAVHFRHALKLDPLLSNAEENLDSIANMLVERWHFRMLNDKQRNEAYRKAIDRAVKQGYDKVLDIGSGTCILSMFAAQSGAKEVHACEMSKTMYDLSLDILTANQMQDSVHVINKKSQSLMIPDDLPGKVSLIVTETLDCGLLGEGIIETLTHAKSELLATNQKADRPKIIPEGAAVYGQIIQCKKIRNYSKVKPRVLGHDFRGVQIRGVEISEKCEEPYTTEEMSCVEHLPLSEPFHIVTYNFQTPENYIEEAKHEVKVPIARTGSLDAIMMWFELRLDSHESLSSAPGCSVCWEQAVYPSRLPESEQTVAEGDGVMLQVRLTSNAILLEVDSIIRHQNVGLESSEQDNTSIMLPYQEISKLNDEKLSGSCNDALLDAFKELEISSSVGDLNTNQHGCIVLCSSPSFNALFALWCGFWPVLCVSNNTNFMQCLQALAGEIEALSFTEKPLEALAGCQNCKVLIVDPVEPCGLLRQGVIEDIVLAKGCVLPKDDGIVLPRKIEVWGMLVSSESLCQKSHVTSNDVTLGLNIAGYMNTFQVKNQIDVDIESNPFESLTDPKLLLTMDFMKPHDDESLLSLLNVTCDTHIAALKEGLADGLMYWFVLGYTKTKKLSTGPESGCHFNQVFVMFKDKFAVVSGQQLLVKTSCKNSSVTAVVQTL